MGGFIKVQLTNDQRKELESDYPNGKSPAFRARCQIVLLNGEGRKSRNTADFFGFVSKQSTNWLNRCKQEGISGLRVKEGGARATFDFIAGLRTLRLSERRSENVGSGFPQPKPICPRMLKNFFRQTEETDRHRFR